MVTARQTRVSRQDAISASRREDTSIGAGFRVAALLLKTSRMSRPRIERPANRAEQLIGRSLAACLHPMAAWHSTMRSFRMLAVAAYFVLGFVAVLTALVLFA